MKNEELIKRDLTHIFHPCTQMSDHEKLLPLLPVKSAKGVYLYDYDGSSYIDAISSWWVNLFGHANPYINQKIKEQLEILEHVIFAGFTHEGAVRLAERLCKRAGLSRLFFADNGSSAVEVALKMSFHAHKNQAKNRKKFMCLENSYHGETLGALSVSDVGLYKEPYGELLFSPIVAKAPIDATFEASEIALDELERLFEKEGENISAFILEPLVQCAGGMRMHHESFVKGVREITKKYGAHLILDEIAVGFGRTGSFFAHEQASACAKPDFLCLSKGLSGGYLPLSVVLFDDEIYDSFYCDYLEQKNFLHSHSYTGNALACSAANAVLDIFDSEDILGKNRELSRYIVQKMEIFRELKSVQNIRHKGMIFAFDVGGFDPKERINLKIYNYAIKNGVLLRPLGNVVYFMPPFVIAKDEIDKIVNVTFDAVYKLEAGLL